eukprot:Gregarina_sp_Poly_1__3018@NODE_1849_length_3212_cov_7_286169_g1200_i0_p2_GENE_NODE_1849_length_3212_cov_7_286169_g1200_i0NODE_1849_length_3212_cov_7_286169_g1200_i0_p2_ORF_typecomplete_len170_score13_71PDEase_I/PF00233_19/5e43_NODE_1849_length_3212_cov_7_286169_g1200_i012261735
MGCWSCLSSLEKKALVISAIGHDIGHPGKNSLFLIKLNHPLALLYNDTSILENYHCSSLLQIMTKPNCNILQDANKATEQGLRQQIIQAVLWTDLIEHFNVMNRTKYVIHKHDHLRGTPIMDDREMKNMLLALALKCGDLSYMAIEPAHYAVQWAIDYYEEVFAQVINI